MAIGVRTLIEERLEREFRERTGEPFTIYFDGKRFTAEWPNEKRQFPKNILDYVRLSKHESRDMVQW